MYKLSDISGDVSQECSSCATDTYSDAKISDYIAGEVKASLWSRKNSKWVHLKMILIPSDNTGVVFDDQFGAIDQTNDYFDYFKHEIPSICEKFEFNYKDGKKAICYYD